MLTKMNNTMRALTFIILLSMCSCQAKDVGQLDDAKRALEDAYRLTERGDYEAALAKHVWYHDNALAVSRSYYGVRLSYALRDWVELGKKYPKALEKLKSIRDEKTSRLLARIANRELFHDVEAINQNLGEVKATVDLFKRIEAVNPVFASRIYSIADVSLVQAHEYVLAKKYLGDPTNRLAAAKRHFETGMQFEKTRKSAASPFERIIIGGRSASETIFTDSVVRIITVLRETGDNAGAKTIQTEALKTLNNDAIRNAVKPRIG